MDADLQVRELCFFSILLWKHVNDALRSRVGMILLMVKPVASSRPSNSSLVRPRPPVITSMFKSRSLPKDAEGPSGQPRRPAAVGCF